MSDNETLEAIYRETREAFLMKRLNSRTPWNGRDLEAHSLALRAVADAAITIAFPVPADTAALIAEARNGDFEDRAWMIGIIDRLTESLDHLSRENVRLQMRVKEANQL